MPRTKSVANPNVAQELVTFVTRELTARADPRKASFMAAYMKTDMPFYGVQKPERGQIARTVRRLFSVTNQRDYERTVKRLWALPYREEKYLAIHVAQLYSDFVTPQSTTLYEKLIREGSWWDFVDEVAIQLVGKVLRKHRSELRPVMDAWVNDDNLWIRRSAIISQVGHKEDTDHRRLFRYCCKRMHETEFFVRKGIGWALHDYSYTAPERVAKLLRENKKHLSGLSYREGAKALWRMGYDLCGS